MIERFSLAELTAATSAADRSVLDRLDAVCTQAGAFVLTDAPVASELLDRLHRDTISFFRLPHEAKSALQSPDDDQFVGWKGTADNRNEFGFPDHKEMFHIGPRVDPTLRGPDGLGRVPAGEPSDGNDCALWPVDLPEFRVTWHRYYQAMQELSNALGLAMAAALGVEARQWRALAADNWADLAANYYPPVGTGPAGVRNAVHSDLTMFTILYQDGGGGGGLHMQGRDGRWVAVPPEEGTFLVNIGELLTYLTDGRWWAVPHEVSEADPSAPESRTVRVSVPFFYRPNDAFTVTPIVRTAHDVSPIQVGDWVRNRKLLARAG
jgi:isopenicillin N synthase-like dioxygenase